MQTAITFGGSEDGLRASTVSPFLEMGAYEVLWQQPQAWFKKIAEIFHDNPSALPSDLVDHDQARDAADTVLSLLDERNARDHFGVRVHRAGNYPAKLRDAAHPCEVLYFRGIWDLVEMPSVAIVGARKASLDGIKRARKLARLLVENEYAVMSGLAAGIDTAAHTAALEAGGRTIAVLGTPLSEVYPKQNEELQSRLAAEHLVISQIPFIRYRNQDFRSNRLFFPERNKTMSALTQATVIVEASDTSGTLIQARAALQQGRKLFILESCFQNKAISWPEKYEKKGAVRIKDFDDILNVLRSSQTPTH